MRRTGDSAQEEQDSLQSIIVYTMQHPVLANLIFCALVLLGLICASQLNVQSMPDMPWPVVSVQVEWPGASAAEVEKNIAVPLTAELRSTGDLRSIESFAVSGRGTVVLDFKTNVDLSIAFDEVRNTVEQINFPQEAERPIIMERPLQDPLLKLVIYSDSVHQLREIAHTAKQDLLSRYRIDKVNIVGLPDEHISLEMDRLDIHRFGLPLQQVAEQIIDVSTDRPIGKYETDTINMAIQMPSKPKNLYDLGKKRVYLNGQSYEVGQFTKATSRMDPWAPYLLYQGKPAVMLEVDRTVQGGSALKMAARFSQWYREAQTQWPQSVRSTIMLPEYKVMQDRIHLLLRNGIMACILMVLTLGLLIRWQVAYWIVLCILAAILGAVVILSYWQVSINFLSSFGFIVAIGLVVDNCIVVAETAYAKMQGGLSAQDATWASTQEMLAPLLASAATTVSAFAPILLMQSRYAVFFQDIPRVIIAMLLASLWVCFLILPHHLCAIRITRRAQSMRSVVESYVHRLQFYRLKKMLCSISAHGVVTITAVAITAVFPYVLWATGHIAYRAVPDIQSDYITLDVDFYPGQDKKTMQNYLEAAQKALRTVERGVSESFIKAALERYRMPAMPSEQPVALADEMMNHASLVVQLSNPALRKISNNEIKRRWQLALPVSVDVEKVSIREPQRESNAQDINVLIRSDDWASLVQSTEAAKDRLRAYPGVQNIKDSVYWDSVVYTVRVRPEASMLGVSQAVLAQQIHDYLHGSEILENNLRGDQKQIITLRLNRDETDNLWLLESFPIYVGGKQMTLGQVATIEMQNLPSLWYQYNGQLAVRVGADVKQGHRVAEVRTAFQKNDKQWLENRFGVDVSAQMESTDERDLYTEMTYGIVVALVSIYFILSWASRSYWLPMAIMGVMPFGLSGALWGHWIMRVDFSLLSMVAVLGLSGVLINGGIILLHQIRLLQKRDCEQDKTGLLVESICHRARALLLTTVATTVGLLPILFEWTIQAQWIHPFVVSMIFGLWFAVVAMVVLLPSLSGLWQSKNTGVWRWGGS